MGTNACWIQVEVDDAKRETVATAIRDYWTSRGATYEGATWRALEPLGLEKVQVLGIAISQVADGWLTLCDSERYTADYNLATYLAETLARRVRFVGIWDVSQHAIDVYIGPGSSQAKTHSYAEYADLKKKQDWSFLVFANVKPGHYDPGPRSEDDDEEVDDEPLLFTVYNAAGRAREYELVDAVRAIARSGPGAELVLAGRRIPFSTVLDAWLVALVFTSDDIAGAAATMETVTAKTFSKALNQWDGFRSTIAEQMVCELPRVTDLPDPTDTIAALVQRIDAGDVHAIDQLERAAITERDVLALRFARAHFEGNVGMARMYRRRLP